jgi:hypothetical protein
MIHRQRTEYVALRSKKPRLFEVDTLTSNGEQAITVQIGERAVSAISGRVLLGTGRAADLAAWRTLL